MFAPLFPVDIEKRESKLENSIHYKILSHYETKDIPGNAGIYFRDVQHYKSKKSCCSNCVYKDCINHGLKNSDIICHLRFFYPNGSVFDDDYMRNGTGSFVLQKIITDALSHHGKMIYVFSTTKYMDSFLNKKNFVGASDFDSQYYLYL